MKSVFPRVLLLLIMAIGILSSLQSCHKDSDKNFIFHFYTTKLMSDSSDLFLYIDGESKGVVPYRASKVTDCGEISGTLRLLMHPGKYKMEMKDKGGNVLSGATGKFYDNKTAVKGTEGSSAVESSQYNDTRCIKIDLH